MSQQFEPQKNGFTLRNPQTGEARSVSYEQYGWNPDRDVEYFSVLPCFSSPELRLLADITFWGDDRAPLALVLLDYPLEDDALLRQIADVYGNSAKRVYGQRPVIYFITDLACKAVYSLLGEVQTPQGIPGKAELEETVASYAIQEVVTFQLLLNDKDAAKGFFAGDSRVRESIQSTILDTLTRASKMGFCRYLHHYVYASREDGKKLPKQLLLLSSMGAKDYHKLCLDDSIAVAKFLGPKSLALLQKANQDNDLDGRKLDDVYEKRQLTWAYAYYGWDIDRDIRRNVEIPCYLDPGMRLLADYVFYNAQGKPLLVVLRDTLNLSVEKAFLVSEFYARSFKRETGSWPLVLFQNNTESRLKMAALSGGFEPIREVIPRPFLEAQVRQVAVTEYLAWSQLLKKSKQLTGIFDPQERQEKILAIVRETLAYARDSLSNPRFVQEQYEIISTQTEILEETFWERVDGADAYQSQRMEDLSLLRTVVADKRMLVREETEPSAP